MLTYIVCALVATFVLRKLYLILFSTTYPAKGKVILVTGAASGIGKASVEVLLSKGCKVYATDISEEGLKAAFQPQSGLICLKMDVTDDKSVENVTKQIENENNGKLFGVINSAGIAYARNHRFIRTITELHMEDEVMPILNINLIGLMRVNSHVVKMLKNNESEHPCIVNIASIAGRYALPWVSTYSTSKFAVIGYSDTLRKEIFPSIRVTCVEPSFVVTPLVENALYLDVHKEKTLFYDKIKEVYPKYMKLIVDAPKLTPTDVANAISRELFSSTAHAHVIISNNWADYLVLYFSWVLPTDMMDWVERKLTNLVGAGATLPPNKHKEK